MPASRFLLTQTPHMPLYGLQVASPQLRHLSKLQEYFTNQTMARLSRNALHCLSLNPFAALHEIAAPRGRLLGGLLSSLSGFSSLKRLDLISLNVGLENALFNGEGRVYSETTADTAFDFSQLARGAGTVGSRAAARLTIIVSKALTKIRLLSIPVADVLGSRGFLIDHTGAEEPVWQTGNDDIRLLAPLPASAIIAGVDDDDRRLLTRELTGEARLTRKGLAREGLAREGLTRNRLSWKRLSRNRLLGKARLAWKRLSRKGLPGNWPARLLGKSRLTRELANKPAALLALLELSARPRADASEAGVDGAALRLAVQVGQTGTPDKLNATPVANVLLAGRVGLELSYSRSGNYERSGQA